jgi:two-component system, NarL family, sensor histidine kinase DesK
MKDAQHIDLACDTFLVLRKPLLFWLRWVGLLAGMVEIVIMARAFASIQHNHRVLIYVAMGVGAIVYGFLYVNNIPLRVNLAPRRERWILAQLLLGSLLTGALTNLSALCAPFCVPVHRRLRWFGIITGFSIASYIYLIIIFRNVTHPPLSQVLHSPSLSLIVTIVFDYCENLFWHIFAYLVGCVLFELAKRQQQLIQANKELVALQTEIRERAKYEERFRLSKELHDSAGHYLTSLSIQLEIAMHRASQEVFPVITKAQLITRLLLAEIRESISSWREEETRELLSALKQLVREVTGVETHLEIRGDLTSVPQSVAHGLFRCVQEALTNVLRHSKARNVWVQLRVQDNTAHLLVKDDGAGCPGLVKGNGLHGMESRVATMGGVIEFTETDLGFALAISAPTAEVGSHEDRLG